MLENILTYSIGSILWGIVISVACVGILLLLIKGWRKNSFFNLVSYIAAGILFLILAYNCTGICSAVAMKSDIAFTESMISQMIGIAVPDYYSNYNQQASSEIIRQVINENPILNYFFDSSNIEDCKISELPHVLASKLYDSLNSMILKKSLWSVAFLIIAGIVIVKTMDNGGAVRRRSSSSRYSSERIASRNRPPISRRR